MQRPRISLAAACYDLNMIRVNYPDAAGQLLFILSTLTIMFCMPATSFPSPDTRAHLAIALLLTPVSVVVLNLLLELSLAGVLFLAVVCGLMFALQRSQLTVTLASDTKLQLATALAIVAGTSPLVVYLTSSRPHPVAMTEHPPSDGLPCIKRPYRTVSEQACIDEFSTTIRTDFSSSVPHVRSFPSTGGILLLDFDIAVAEYLNLPRLKSVDRSTDAAQEDAFCNRMRLLGAEWWSSERAYHDEGAEYDDSGKDVKRLVVGWPSDGKGVWMLGATSYSRLLSDSCKLRMCTTMDERCQLLEELGATFYSDPKIVPEFAGVL